MAAQFRLRPPVSQTLFKVDEMEIRMLREYVHKSRPRLVGWIKIDSESETRQMPAAGIFLSSLENSDNYRNDKTSQLTV